MLAIVRNATTYHFTTVVGTKPLRFSVVFVKGSLVTQVECEGRTRSLAWKGDGYRPGSDEQLAAAAEKFLQLEDRAEAQRSKPSDRQLPAGDRA